MPLRQPIRPAHMIDTSHLTLSLDPGEAAAEREDFIIERQLDELYADAVAADRRLGRFINHVASEFPGVVAGIRQAPLKRRADAKKKLFRGGHRSKDVEDLKDIARATIEFHTLEALIAAREFIKTKKSFTNLDHTALKDRYTPVREGGLGPTDQGYQDIKFFLLMKIDGGRRHIVELQLNLVGALMAKDVGHPFYDVIRLGGTGWDPRLPNSDILIPSDLSQKIGSKLLHACHECIHRGVEPAKARIVKNMVKRKFFRPVYARYADGRPMFDDNRHRNRVVDRYEPRTNSIRLTFNTPADVDMGLALSEVSCAAYAYYNAYARQYRFRTANNIHDWW